MKRGEYLTDGVQLADIEDIAAFKRQNDLYLFEEDLANLRNWKDKKCDQLLLVIDKMIAGELARRINIERASL